MRFVIPVFVVKALLGVAVGGFRGNHVAAAFSFSAASHFGVPFLVCSGIVEFGMLRCPTLSSEDLSCSIAFRRSVFEFTMLVVSPLLAQDSRRSV